ncbi:hypothetical protein TNCV_3639961 [Trichonephila clavipes]|nr:hypothetical protein TNCV_3639961 [Trichonephila clavipes]
MRCSPARIGPTKRTRYLQATGVDCKCIVPLQHGGPLSSHRAASPLLKLVKRKKRREAPDHLQGVLP